MKQNEFKKLKKELDNNKYKCKENCFECCTAVFFLPEEFKLMKKELLKNGLKEPPNGKGNLYCEYLTTEGRCSVYNARPIVCRAFGNIKFCFKNSKKELFTQSCTYAKEIIKQGSPEFIKYGDEVMKNGYMNINAEGIVKSAVHPIIK